MFGPSNVKSHHLLGEAIRAGEWALGRINDERYEGHLVLV